MRCDEPAPFFAEGKPQYCHKAKGHDSDHETLISNGSIAWRLAGGNGFDITETRYPPAKTFIASKTSPVMRPTERIVMDEVVDAEDESVDAMRHELAKWVLGSIVAFAIGQAVVKLYDEAILAYRHHKSVEE